MRVKRTKIICTIGPASARPATLEAMIRAGMDVARLNFSHGTHKSHAALVRSIRAAAKKTGRLIGILADLQGPKIRFGELPKKGVSLSAGSEWVLDGTVREAKGNVLPVSYSDLARDVKKGEHVLMDDGLLSAKITAVHGTRVHVRVVHGGILTSHKGLNFPDSSLRVSAFTEKDQTDAAFAVSMEVDWIALSFVRGVDEVDELRACLAREASRRKQPSPNVMVKIEKPEALKNFPALLEVADGVMIARGDLGVEVPMETVPVHQKEMIAACRMAGKPVVVATQMLDSMIRSPRATRAEVSDVAHAVFDHTDAVMLSGESANGAYPVEAVRLMAHIIKEAEASPYDDVAPVHSPLPSRVHSASETLRDLAYTGRVSAALASLAVTPWAPRLNMQRPELPLFIGTQTAREAGKLTVHWGVQPFVLRASRKNFFGNAIAYLVQKTFLRKGAQIALLNTEENGFERVRV